MISKNFKILVDSDGKEYRFNHFNFRNCIRNYCKEKKNLGEKVTQEEVREELCEYAQVSSDAARNWMYGYNGPAEIQIVKDMATYLNVDYRILLTNKEQENMSINAMIENETINEGTVNAIKRIYAMIATMAEEIPNMMEALEFDGDLPEKEYSLYDSLATYESLKRIIHLEMLNIPEKLFWDFLNYCETKFGIFFEVEGYETIWVERYLEYYRKNGYPEGKENDSYDNDFAQYKFQIEYQNSVYTDMNVMLRQYIE